MVLMPDIVGGHVWEPCVQLNKAGHLPHLFRAFLCAPDVALNILMCHMTPSAHFGVWAWAATHLFCDLWAPIRWAGDTCIRTSWYVSLPSQICAQMAFFLLPIGITIAQEIYGQRVIF